MFYLWLSKWIRERSLESLSYLRRKWKRTTRTTKTTRTTRTTDKSNKHNEKRKWSRIFNRSSLSDSLFQPTFSYLFTDVSVAYAKFKYSLSQRTFLSIELHSIQELSSFSYVVVFHLLQISCHFHAEFFNEHPWFLYEWQVCLASWACSYNRCTQLLSMSFLIFVVDLL